MNRLFILLFTMMLWATHPAAAQGGEIIIDTAVITGSDYGAEKESFLPITQAAPVAVRKLPLEKVEALKKSEDYWYANLVLQEKAPPKQKAAKTERNFFSADWFQNLLWIVILCAFIGVVIWYLASSNIALFRKTSEAITTEQDADEISEDIFSIAYEKEIGKAEAAGNYRLAIRLWYLSTLKDLSARNLVVYRPEKPDSDYVASLYGSSYYRDFFGLTRAFEFTWYGGFSPATEGYERIQVGFQNFKNSLPA
ncbi:MAG TPA: hypothetical protein VM871_11700 [Flavisolibacter sp.]|nr:hypothetical protein [Flavisolibacter sp.]